MTKIAKSLNPHPFRNPRTRLECGDILQYRQHRAAYLQLCVGQRMITICSEISPHRSLLFPQSPLISEQGVRPTQTCFLGQGFQPGCPLLGGWKEPASQFSCLRIFSSQFHTQDISNRSMGAALGKLPLPFPCPCKNTFFKYNSASLSQLCA